MPPATRLKAYRENHAGDEPPLQLDLTRISGSCANFVIIDVA